MAGEFSSIFSTPFGVGKVHESEYGIFKVDLPDISGVATIPGAYITKSNPSCLTEYTSELLCRYFAGELIKFGEIPVDLSFIPLFRSKILQAIRIVPYGNVRSYGQIATECGSPLAARAVGGAMASNPVPIIIPCHRIVGSNGSLTGFSAPGGVSMKKMLLKMEGVEFKGMLAIQKQLVMNR